MSLTLTVPPEYGYVILTVAGTFFLSTWHGVRVSAFRKAAGPQVTYPAPYADSYNMSSADPELKKNMYLFNCAQRAHANYLENHSSVIAAMLIGGIRYPVVTTLMGLGWSVSRVVYALGYTAKDKENGKGRLAGSPMWLFQFGLFIMTGVTGYKLAF